MKVCCIPGSDIGTGDVAIKEKKIKKKKAKIPFFTEFIVKKGRGGKDRNINTDNLLGCNIGYQEKSSSERKKTG